MWWPGSLTCSRVEHTGLIVPGRGGWCARRTRAIEVSPPTLDERIKGGLHHGYVWEGGVGRDSCPDCTGPKGVAGPHDQGKQDRDPARGDPGKGIVVFDVHPHAASECDGGAEAAGSAGCRG